ncbi:hypothetical protein AB1Y20_002315 [Prymnesium parvum]|uniref:Uncharacterized protein n=1 Tax=Prymnesium parvum TaxID=97485 RepID=A0AB34J8L4_PRYPA
MPHQVVDYSKWELVADDDDKKERQYREVREHHQESMTVIAGFLRATSPGIKSSELRRHLDFISVQHRGIYETNLKRAAEICAFLERLGPDEQLDSHKLAELVRAARKQSEEGDEKERTRGLLVLNVAMGALNTLAAVNDIGKPRWLFDMLHSEPEGPVMKKYKDFGYALDELGKPPVDPYARELPVDMKSWCSKLWKAVALQMAISLVLMSVALSVLHHFGPDWEAMGFNADSNDAGRLHEPKPLTMLQDDDWETAQQEL